MTTMQFLTLAGIIYLAPTLEKPIGTFAGLLIFSVAIIVDILK